MPHPGEATGVRDGTISLPDWDVHSGYTEGISLGGELGAIAQGVTVRGRIVPSPEPPFFRRLRLPKKRARKNSQGIKKG
jgi:hypothetical protein